MIAWVLAGSLALSPAPSPPAEQGEPPKAYVPERSFLIPALEVAASEFLLVTFNNIVDPKPWALVSWERIIANVDGTHPWEFDVDIFEINQFGHPYQGAIYFTAARSSGLSFWVSALYTFAGSLLWEVAMENEAPSINDQITTTLGGIFLGEALHRAYLALMDDRRGTPVFTRRLTAAALSPISAANRWLYGTELGEVIPPSLLEGSFNVGVAVLGRYGTAADGVIVEQSPQLLVSGELSYGAWDAPLGPFSMFNVEGSVTAPGLVTAQLYIRGLLGGWAFDPGWTRGVFGAYGLYDFAANNILRVSSVGAGPGVATEAFMGKSLRVRSTLILAAIGLGAAGALEDVEDGDRDYRIGPGGQVVGEVQLAHRTWGALSLRARYWQLTRLYVEQVPALESVLYVTAAASVTLGPRLAIGVQIPVYLRNFGIGPERDLAFGSGPRLMVSILSEDGFGP